MNGSVVDTNVIIEMIKKNASAYELLDGIENKYVSIIVVGELLHGAYKSTKRETTLETLNSLLFQFKVLCIDEDVARSYALIKTDLQKKGAPIPDNDIWIAATAHANNLSVATFDEHFNNISQIEIVPIA